MDNTTYLAAKSSLTEWLKTEDRWPDARDPEFSKYLVKHRVTPHDYEKAMTSLICWAEDPHQPYGALAAIALVLFNRAGGTSPYLEAIRLRPPHFDMTPDELDLKFERLLANVDALYAGELYDVTQGATKFIHADEFGSGVINPAFRAVIGDYTFFS